MGRAVLAWSGGKDAAVALDATHHEVVELFTTTSAATGRSTMHGVRAALYEAQADALGLPVSLVELPPEPSDEVYASVMAEALSAYAERGVEAVVFGDLFLGDVRAYREERLSGSGLSGDWPLWGRDTGELVRDAIDAGLRATVVAVDGDVLDAAVAGRAVDEAFLDELPDGVDPCGENGEFHTFVHDGPGFSAPVAVRVGETVTRTVDGRPFHYADLLPG